MFHSLLQSFLVLCRIPRHCFGPFCFSARFGGNAWTFTRQGDEFDEDPADHDVESQISGEGLSEITWWDIPGPPLDSPVVYSDIPAASVFLVVYDITSPTSVGRIREVSLTPPFPGRLLQ